ncbi:MAG TPA: molecular chaperone DnaK [Candidatus Binatia bacterium]|jgi:molecular chaperone DnaK
MGKILGIDLGTTNSVMAVWDGREPRLIASQQGSRLTPSVVAFGANGDVFVGEVARRQAVANARCTIFSAKRFMGQQFEAVAADREVVPYEVVAGDHGEAQILVGDQRWMPEQISAHVLRELKRSAEFFLGEPVDGAVITVPAYFNDAQRTATKEAGRLAGLDVRRIINEPTAAALAYGLDKNHEKCVAVYDFGGGTFDVSILTVGDDVIEVISTHGDTHLGGDDIDARIVAWLIAQFEEKTGIHINGDAVAHQRLREAAEHAKIDLSSRTATDINLPFLAADASGPQHLEVAMSRGALEEMIADLVERTLSSCVQALSDAGRGAAEIDEIVLVGGSSRIPLVQKRVTEYFRKEPRRTVNPDEVVALGAAVQAGVLSGEIKGLVLLDVTSLSLGVETFDGLTASVIPRNTTIPTEAMRTFTTAADGQTSVEVHVVQGEADRAKLNDSLGRFDLDGIEAAPKGAPQIDVTFAIDLNGMVKVSARDRATGRSQTVSVSARTAVANEPALGGKTAETNTTTTRPLHEGTARSAQTLDQPVAQHAAWQPGPPAGQHPVQQRATQAARDAGAKGASHSAASDARQKEASPPPPVDPTLQEVDRLLGQVGDKLAANDRVHLEKNARELRGLLSEQAASEEVERSRSALRGVVGRIKEALLQRRAR